MSDEPRFSMLTKKDIEDTVRSVFKEEMKAFIATEAALHVPSGSHPMPSSEFWRQKDITGYYHISRATVARLVKSGVLPTPERIGTMRVYHTSEVIAAMDKYRRKI